MEFEPWTDTIIIASTILGAIIIALVFAIDEFGD